MSEATAEGLAQRVQDLGLVDDRQLQIAWAGVGGREISGDAFLQLLVRQGALTNYQIERLLNGERSGFFYGQYKIQYLVGAGTFARVFRAVDTENDRVVAVKVLRTRFSDNPATYHQFIHEGEVGKTFRHPNIVPIFDVQSKGRQHFIAMEFVEGQNLREFVRIRKKFDPLEASKIILDAAAGLSYAIERGLSHRDLKLSNVLVTSLGRGKLVDFGMAGMSEHFMDQTGGEVDAHAARTVDYAALERITRAPRHDSRSDIYFLGAMYYHLLTGEAPLFETRDRAKRMSKHRFLDVTPLHDHDQDIPMSVTLVVNRAMSLDLSRRYGKMSELHDDLKHVVERLKAGDTDEHPTDEAAARKAAPAGVITGKKYTLMIVEPNAKMQDVFREGFKKAGYRVLVVSDPKRAAERIFDSPESIDCVLLNAQLLGNKAVRVFNELNEDLRTNDIPALLLLDDNQKAWAKKCRVAPHRLIIGMPVTMKGLRVTLAKILQKKNGEEEAASEDAS